MVTSSMTGLGGERAQHAALLALVTVLLSAANTSGCRRDASPIVSSRYIRIQALLPLHPAWRQLESMEVLARRQLPAPIELHFAPVVLPVPFVPPRGLPPSRVVDHEKVVHEDAARYIAQLEAALAVRNRELTDAERRAAAQSERTEFDNALQKRVNELRDDAAANAKVLQQQLQQLNYRLEALASQSRVYVTVGASARRMLDDVKLQQAEVERRAQLRNTEITGILHADFKGLAEQSLKSYRDKLDSDAARRVADFQSRQSSADEQEIAQAKTRIDSQPTPIPPLLDLSNEIINPSGAALVQGISPPDAKVFASAMADMSKTDQAQKRALEERIGQLKTMIEADTLKAVEDIARRERWTVTERKTADDWTEIVAAKLRSQWTGAAVR